MFYFGGMTLGYLSPYGQNAKADDGNNVAEQRQDQHRIDASEPLKPSRKELIARANWFSFYW